MFKELLDLSHELEGRPDYPQPGFYRYSPNAPIRWVVRISFAQPPRVRLLQLELANLRPYSGRTSGVSAYPLVDEASYALGVDEAKGKKPKAFLDLLQKMAEAPEIVDPQLQQAIALVRQVLDQQLVKGDVLYRQIKDKDWVSFVVEIGELSDRQLFEHPEVQRFWLRHLSEMTNVPMGDGSAIWGECSVCGVERELAGRIPLGVKLSKPNPLISQNADAYVSRVDGAGSFERAALSLCLECGESATRALNYLSNTPQHNRPLLTNPQKNDDLDNYHALFWLRRAPIREASSKSVADLGALLDAVPALMERAAQEPQQPIGPPPVLKQLEDLLKVPWSANEHATTLSDERFYLLLLSPNKGRIAVRDWISVSLGTLRHNLTQFLDALRIVGPDGAEPRSFTIPMILDALKRPKSKLADASDTRGLLRAAYLGEHPDWALLARALIRFCSALRGLDDRPSGARELPPPLRFHICAAVLKLFCVFGKENASDMTTLEEHPAYLCGRLLAVLEEIQRRAAGKTKLNVTLVERLYSAAALTPAATLSAAMNRAQAGHLPKLRREGRRYEQVQQLLQGIFQALVDQGGMPNALTPVEQAKFALGYYTQRAVFNPAYVPVSMNEEEA